MPDAAIADVANVLFRKCLIGRLEFLQAGDVRLRLRQPFQQARQAGLDPVDVVCRYAHNLCLDPINPHSREGREITNAHPADNAEGGFPTSRNDEYLKEGLKPKNRSEEHTSELQSLMRISYAGFCLK